MKKEPEQKLNQFRDEIYQTLQGARDAVFEIIDAITTSPLARSAVEVSLSPHMERTYSSVYKGLQRTKLEADQLRPLLVRYAESQGELVIEGAAVYALDHSPYPRKHAPTVSDRGTVHGADGQVIGHHYS
ncbi:MAG: transposase [Blastocatellia bacterium]|nr:transposase [Blastocatellia bacterium]